MKNKIIIALIALLLIWFIVIQVIPTIIFIMKWITAIAIILYVGYGLRYIFRRES